MTPRRFALVLIASTLAAFASGSASAQTGAQKPMTLPGAAPAKAPEDPVVVKVNDTVIRQSDVMAMHAQLPEQYRNMPVSVLFQAIVGQLINRRLAAIAATSEGLDKQPDIQRALERIKERLLEQAYVSKRAGESIDEKALRERYAAAKASGALSIEEVRASHILVEDEAVAKDVHAQVKGGADFAKVAQAKSKDGSAGAGGDLGFFDRSVMVPAFADAAFALQKGQISAPVQTQFGWHVIRLEDRRTRDRSFEEAEEELRDMAYQEAQSTVIEGLRKGARIEQP